MFTHKQAEDRVALGFWIHFGAYLVVTGSLIALNFTRNPDHPWSLWMAAGWGLGVAAHAAAFLFPESRERMITRTILRMEQREQKLGQH